MFICVAVRDGMWCGNAALDSSTVLPGVQTGPSDSLCYRAAYLPERVANRREGNKSKGAGAILFCCGTTCAAGRPEPVRLEMFRRSVVSATYRSLCGEANSDSDYLRLDWWSRSPSVIWLAWAVTALIPRCFWRAVVWRWRRWEVFRRFYASVHCFSELKGTQTRVRWEMEDRSVYLRVRESRRGEARERRYVFVCQWEGLFSMIQGDRVRLTPSPCVLSAAHGPVCSSSWTLWGGLSGFNTTKQCIQGYTPLSLFHSCAFFQVNVVAPTFILFCFLRFDMMPSGMMDCSLLVELWSAFWGICLFDGFFIGHCVVFRILGGNWTIKAVSVV